MSFAHPIAFALGLLAIPLVLLYWRATRVPQHVVTTDWLWEQALAEEHIRARWQKYRTGASLALHLAVLALVTLAAAGPALKRQTHCWAIVIDNSKSTRAPLKTGTGTRLDAEKAYAQQMLNSALMQEGNTAVIVAAAGAPSQLTGITSDRASLATAIDRIAPSDEPASVPWTLATIRDLWRPPGTEMPEVFVLTDGSSGFSARMLREAQEGSVPFGAPVKDKESGLEYTVLNFGESIERVVIARCAARRLPDDPKQCALLVELHNQSEQTANGSLVISLDDRPQEKTPVTFIANGRFTRQTSTAAPAGGKLSVHFEPPDKFDSGFHNDQATIQLPPARIHRVVFVGDDRSPVGPVLKSEHAIELVEKPVPDSSAITVYDAHLPETLPSGPCVVFNPGNTDLWQLGSPIRDPAVGKVDDASPVVHDIHFHEAYLAEARAIKIKDDAAGASRPILWTENGVPLAYAIDRPKGRVLVFLGNTALGNLTLQSSFPQLLRQALDWVSDAKAEAGADVWYAAGTAATASTTELDLRCPKPQTIGNLEPYVERTPFWVYLAALALILMIVEWCLYQRRWLC